MRPLRRRKSRAAIAADERHEEVYPAWQDVRLDRDAEKNKNHPPGALPPNGPELICNVPIPETESLRKTLNGEKKRS